jgi:hypothetical protein
MERLPARLGAKRREFPTRQAPPPIERSLRLEEKAVEISVGASHRSAQEASLFAGLRPTYPQPRGAGGQRDGTRTVIISPPFPKGRPRQAANRPSPQRLRPHLTLRAPKRPVPAFPWKATVAVCATQINRSAWSLHVEDKTGAGQGPRHREGRGPSSEPLQSPAHIRLGVPRPIVTPVSTTRPVQSGRIHRVPMGHQALFDAIGRSARVSAIQKSGDLQHLP